MWTEEGSRWRFICAGDDTSTASNTHTFQSSKTLHMITVMEPGAMHTIRFPVIDFILINAHVSTLGWSVCSCWVVMTRHFWRLSIGWFHALGRSRHDCRPYSTTHRRQNSQYGWITPKKFITSRVMTELRSQFIQIMKKWKHRIHQHAPVENALIHSYSHPDQIQMIHCYK